MQDAYRLFKQPPIKALLQLVGTDCQAWQMRWVARGAIICTKWNKMHKYPEDVFWQQPTRPVEFLIKACIQIAGPHHKNNRIHASALLPTLNSSTHPSQQITLAEYIMACASVSSSQLKLCISRPPSPFWGELSPCRPSPAWCYNTQTHRDLLLSGYKYTCSTSAVTFGSHSYAN